jgi:glutaminase
MNIQVSLDSIYKYLKSKKFGGKNADYIPELESINPNLYAISIFTVDGKSFNVGDCNHEFAIESVSKVFSLALALKKKGVETVSKKIGTKQTNQPFNSISDIDLTTDHMLNSFENGGAMATTSLSYDKNKKKFEEKIFDMMSKFAGRKLTYSKSIYNSEITNSDHNRAIAYLLNSYGKFYGDVEETLDVYTKQCSALVTSKDVAVMAATLANKGINPKTGEKVIDAKFLPYILAHMSANGLYEYSETWMTHIGMPAKSGVSGVLLIVMPGVMGIGIISPPLDEHGNSVKGIITAMTLAQHMHLGIFDQNNKVI